MSLKIHLSNRFESWNDKILTYADHPFSLGIFGVFCFLSGSFLPVPVDPLFLVICLKQPQRSWLFAAFGSLCVTLGGLLMYVIGYSLYFTVGVWLIELYKWQAQFEFFKVQIFHYGAWIIILKAFTPIPYKLLALIAGIGHLNIWVFLASSFVGRFLRLGMEILFLRFFGRHVQVYVQKYLSLGLMLVFLFLIFLTFFSFFIFKI